MPRFFLWVQTARDRTLRRRPEGIGVVGRGPPRGRSLTFIRGVGGSLLFLVIVLVGCRDLPGMVALVAMGADAIMLSGSRALAQVRMMWIRCSRHRRLILHFFGHSLQAYLILLSAGFAVRGSPAFVNLNAAPCGAISWPRCCSAGDHEAAV